jgi:hypothetical protein
VKARAAAFAVLAAAAAHAGADGGGAGALGLDLHAQGDVVDLLVAVRAGKDTTLEHRRSRDGGRTWSAPATVPTGAAGLANPHRGADPQLAAAGDRIVVLWTAPGSSPWGSGPLATALSADGGRTWTAGPNPADDRSTGGHGYADLAADPAGAFHAVWLDGRDGGQGLRAAVSDDGGRSWRRNVTVDDRTCECCWNRAIAPAARSVRVIYRDKDPRDLFVAGTEDGGATWSRRGAAGDFRWQFEGCPHVGGGLAQTGDGRLHALSWTAADGREGQWVLASSDGGRTWTPPARLGGPRAHRGDLAAADRRLAAVWDEASADGSTVLGAVSADGGTGWPAPRVLSEAGASASFPVAAATARGFLACWTQTRGEAAAEWRCAPL